jgi:hypothetical protein
MGKSCKGTSMKKLDGKFIIEILQADIEKHTKYLNHSVGLSFETRYNTSLKISKLESQIFLLKEPKTSTKLRTVEGGDWLAFVRNYIQCKFTNGENVSWGSDEVLQGPAFTVNTLESFAANVASVAVNEFKNLRGAS